MKLQAPAEYWEKLEKAYLKKGIIWVALSVVIAGLTLLVDCCTANNTVAIVMAGPIAKEISDEFGVDPKRSASLLATPAFCITSRISLQDKNTFLENAIACR